MKKQLTIILLLFRTFVFAQTTVDTAARPAITGFGTGGALIDAACLVT